MRHSNVLFPLASSLLAGPALAWAPPGYAGFNTVWSDSFGGASGSSPNGNNWNIVTGNLGVNNELQTWSKRKTNHLVYSRNLQLSGGDTLQLVPWRDGGAANGWTSGRVESKYVLAPRAGGVTRVEAQLRFGDNSPGAKQGLWPAFWMLGQALRQGTGWPAAGELDVMETVNGQLLGHGTIHCDVYPGGVCNEPTGIGAQVAIPDQAWHVWRIEFDLRNGDWAAQTLQWSLDGNVFQTVSGARIGNQAVWNALAHSPMYILLNMAVGGDWPGYPNAGTQDGYGSMMEVAYVAHYQT
ncbi:glycoside hydrolase family 16 protein [Apiospora kogelbergensis]|uniref:Glycoside hydrolase family 16 protein n=1 Tax=Apiospora kogelbergensis TaxID=1337665 RepID=A0AAW0Q699_9PEZI